MAVFPARRLPCVLGVPSSLHHGRQPALWGKVSLFDGVACNGATLRDWFQSPLLPFSRLSLAVRALKNRDHSSPDRSHWSRGKSLSRDVTRTSKLSASFRQGSEVMAVLPCVLARHVKTLWLVLTDPEPS